MLEIKDLHASINGKEILKGINLTVKSGEVHAIMGPNGSGKSTLSNVLVGAAVVYGIMHAEPQVPGGPPLPRFPWLGWGIGALLLPVGLLLILHLSGLMVGRTLDRPADGAGPHTGGAGTGDAPLPPHVERFYSIVRHAPTVVILLSLLVFGGLLIFVDGLLESLGRVGMALLPYLPWLVGGLVVFLTVCYVARQFFLYRHHQMEREYAFRQSVLERTGVILLPDGKTPLQLPPTAVSALPAGERPPAPSDGPATPPQPTGDSDDADIVDADVEPCGPKPDMSGPNTSGPDAGR